MCLCRVGSVVGSRLGASDGNIWIVAEILRNATKIGQAEKSMNIINMRDTRLQLPLTIFCLAGSYLKCKCC